MCGRWLRPNRLFGWLLNPGTLQLARNTGLVDGAGRKWQLSGQNSVDQGFELQRAKERRSA